MTPNSGACSINRTRNPLRASASATEQPPSPPPTTRTGSDVRVTAAPRIRFHANPLSGKRESRALWIAQRSATRDKNDSAESKCWKLRVSDSEDSGIFSAQCARSCGNADPLDFPVQIDAGIFFDARADRLDEGLDVRGSRAAEVD